MKLNLIQFIKKLIQMGRRKGRLLKERSDKEEAGKPVATPKKPKIAL